MGGAYGLMGYQIVYDDRLYSWNCTILTEGYMLYGCRLFLVRRIGGDNYCGGWVYWRRGMKRALPVNDDIGSCCLRLLQEN